MSLFGCLALFEQNFLICTKIADDAFIPSIDEILAEDWYVVKDEKLHTFEEAIAAYKRGDTIYRESSNYIEYAISHTVKYPFRSEDVLANDWIIVGDEIGQ